MDVLNKARTFIYFKLDIPTSGKEMQEGCHAH